MKSLDWIREKYVYVVVLVLLLLLLWTMWVFQQGNMDVEAAKVYLQALTAAATLALLYYAYFNVASKKEEDTARLELAVRPILIWELESEGKGALFTYKTIKHPLYDFHAALLLDGKKLEMEDHHLDVAEVHAGQSRVRNVTKFISEGLGKEDMRVLQLEISYHSEVGGKYVFLFTKEVLRKKSSFLFQHRKFVSAKYPWRSAPVTFEND
jgi:hypothetical protein